MEWNLYLCHPQRLRNKGFNLDDALSKSFSIYSLLHNMACLNLTWLGLVNVNAKQHRTSACSMADAFFFDLC